ncbi:hypothetical protein Tco_0553204 [Tanacetum coccineum]
MNICETCLGAAVELSPTLYLDVGVVKHNLLRGGNSASGISSLRSTGGGMDSETGGGGSGDDGNGNDVGTGGGKCSDNSGGGSGGVAAYSAMRAFMDGDIGGLSLTVFRALRRRV